MSPIPRRNNFIVRFKDALGVIHEQTLDIECSIDDLWTYFEVTEQGTFPSYSTSIYVNQSNKKVYFTYADSESPWTDYIGTFDTDAITTETLNTDIHIIGYRKSTNLNSSGEPIVATFDDTGGYNSVIILSKVLGTWTKETVYSHAGYGFTSQIHLLRDSSNYLHIVHGGIDASTSQTAKVFYSTNSSGSWQTEEISSYTVVGFDPITTYTPFAVIDSSDNIHVLIEKAFSYGGVYETLYLTGTYGSWSAPETVANTAATARTIASMAVAPNDTIAYINYETYSTYRYKPSGDSWQSSEVIVANAYVYLGSLGFDSTNIAHTVGSLISYSYGTESIRNYSRAGGTWGENYISQNYQIYAGCSMGILLSDNIMFVISPTSSLSNPTTNGIAFLYRYL